MVMVAPLTTALMTSVPASKAGVASAINNAISRVGSPLVNAVIFVAVASSFYATIADRVPGVDVASPRFREQVAPLNAPTGDVPPEVRAAARDASTDAFHLAVVVSAALLLAGAAVNGIGIRNPTEAGRGMGPAGEQPPAEPGADRSRPVPVAPDEFARPARRSPMMRGPAHAP
jgi:hypothetical protein